MKVKELIAILQTMPHNAIVTGYNGHEETAEVLIKTIRHYRKGESYFYKRNSKQSRAEHVDIMGH